MMNIRAIRGRIKDWWLRLKGNERLSLIFELVIVVATTCYAVVALYQWGTMKDSNNINRESLISVQRAFVQLSGLAAQGVVKRFPSGD